MKGQRLPLGLIEEGFEQDDKLYVLIFVERELKVQADGVELVLVIGAALPGESVLAGDAIEGEIRIPAGNERAVTNGNQLVEEHFFVVVQRGEAFEVKLINELGAQRQAVALARCTQAKIRIGDQVVGKLPLVKRDVHARLTQRGAQTQIFVIVEQCRRIGQGFAGEKGERTIQIEAQGFGPAEEVTVGVAHVKFWPDKTVAAEGEARRAVDGPLYLRGQRYIYA